jgi:glucose/mannose-6-phosphate isomerase
MLDDLKMIHDRDSKDTLGVAAKQYEQLMHEYDVNLEFKSLKNIVWSGMGGSAFPAQYIKSWPDTYIPFEIVHDYKVPEYVNQNTLFIVSSYSGNTEESLAALADAESKEAQIVVISAGGELVEKARASNYALFSIPSGVLPRMSSFYFLGAAVQLFEALHIIESGSFNALKEAGEWLKDQTENWKPEIPTAHNPAKELSLELIGKSIVVYSGPRLFPAANKLKIAFNENSKNVSWVNQYPEFNHNEFSGWTSHPINKPYAVIEIRSNLENERVQKRFEMSEQLLSGKRPKPVVIRPEGDNLIKQLLWQSVFGDYVSLYLALLNGLDPTPLDSVDRLKDLLGK